MYPEDVFKEVESHGLTRLHLSSSYSCTERWTKDSLVFKVMKDMLYDETMQVKDIQGRLVELAGKEIDPQYANPNDIAIFVYCLALQEFGSPLAYREGLEIIRNVPNLHWARRFQLERDTDDEE